MMIQLAFRRLKMYLKFRETSWKNESGTNEALDNEESYCSSGELLDYLHE